MNRNEQLVASRWIPKGSVKVASKLSGAVAYLYGSPLGRQCVIDITAPFVDIELDDEPTEDELADLRADDANQAAIDDSLFDGGDA